MNDDVIKKVDLYALTSRVIKRVADTQQRLHGLASNSVSWRSIGDDLEEAAAAAKEVARRIKDGEVR